MLRGLTLPGTLSRVLDPFRPCFTVSTFETLSALVAELVAPAGGADGVRDAHRSRSGPGLAPHPGAPVFLAVRWCPHQVGLVVAELVVAHLLPAEAPVTIDDTVKSIKLILDLGVRPTARDGHWGRQAQRHWGRSLNPVPGVPPLAACDDLYLAVSRPDAGDKAQQHAHGRPYLILACRGIGPALNKRCSSEHQQATRSLIRMGAVERQTKRRDRRTYYRIRPGTWTAVFEQQIERTAKLRQLAKQGLGLLNDEPTARRNRLEELHDLTTFYERECLALIARWHRDRVQEL